MKSYVRFQRTPHRRYPAARNHLIKPRIGYLYRTGQEERLLTLFMHSQEDDNHAQE